MRFAEIICSDCLRPHGTFLAEEVAFEGQPTIAPTDYPLSARYAAFNRKFFGGSLPIVPVGLNRMKGLAGRVSYKVQGQQSVNPLMARIKGKYYNSSIVPNTLKLELSSDFRRPESAFDSILLHEMIHVEMAATGQFSENHGPVFLSRARQISSVAGIPVPAVCPSDWFAVPTNQAVKSLGLLLLRKKNGGHSFALTTSQTAERDVEVMRTRWDGQLRYVGLERVTLWVVRDATWSALSMDVPIQRSLGSKTQFFILKNESPLADLERDGKLLLDIKQ